MVSKQEGNEGRKYANEEGRGQEKELISSSNKRMKHNSIFLKRNDTVLQRQCNKQKAYLYTGRPDSISRVPGAQS